MKSNIEKLTIFLSQMSHFDPDNMQMGAKSVCQMVLSGSLCLQSNPTTSQLILTAFLTQMSSQNHNVYSFAINCISQMVSFLPPSQIQKIFSFIIESISSFQTDQQKRQIYGICAGTIIHQAKDQHGQKLRDLAVQGVKELIREKDQVGKDNSIYQKEIILIGLVAQFIRKWPQVVRKVKHLFQCDLLVIYLLKNVQTKNKLQIIKKSEAALGKVSLILCKANFLVLFEDKQYGLLNYLQMNCGQIQNDNMSNLRTGLLCLANILKVQNIEIKSWISRIGELLYKCILLYKNNQSIDKMDTTCDILDSCLSCVSYLFKLSPRTLQNLPQYTSNSLLPLIKQLLNFDLQCQLSYISADEPQMQQQNIDQYDCDYYEQEMDNDQKGWKVRRATIGLLITLVDKCQIWKSIIRQQEIISILANKIIETNTMVTQMAFLMFNFFIDSLTISNIHSHSQTSNQEVKLQQKKFVKMIIKEIKDKLNIIFKSSKTSNKQKSESNKLLYRLIYLAKPLLFSQAMLGTSLLFSLSYQFNSSQLMEQKTICLQSLTQLIDQSLPYKETLTCCLQNLQNKNPKLLTAIYKCLECLLRHFYGQISYSLSMNKILNHVKTKLKQHDADRNLKNSLLNLLGQIFAIINTIDQDDQKDILTPVIEKLKLQVDKTIILQQIAKIPVEYGVKQGNASYYLQILQLSVSFLSNSNTQTNIQLMKTIPVLLNILKYHLTPNMIDYILKCCFPMLNQQKCPQFVMFLIPLYPLNFKPYIQLLIKCSQASLILLLLQNSVCTKTQCLTMLKTIQKQQSFKKISFILAKIGIQQNLLRSQIDISRWGGVCIEALGYVGNSNTSKFIIDSIINNTKEQFRNHAANALGNIAARHNTQLIQQIMQITLQTKQYYVFICTIREYLNFSIADKQTKQVEPSLSQWLLKLCQINFQSETIYQLISQCLAKICILQKEGIQTLISNAFSPIQFQRLVIANSLRFYIQSSQPDKHSQFVPFFVQTIIKLLNDSSINVKYSATKSLQLLGNKQIELFLSLIHQQFWTYFIRNLYFNQEFIIVVDYGVSKQKKDLGRPLRQSSYNLLQTILNSYLFQQDNSLFGQLLYTTLNDITKQTNTDLIIKRLICIRRFAQININKFAQHIELLIKKIGVQQGILKVYNKQATNQDQRNDIYLKGIFKQLLSIQKMVQKQNIQKLKNYFTTLRSTQRFAPLFQTMNKKQSK